MQLVKDVDNATPLRQPYKNLFAALPHQAKIYLQIMDKATSKEQKRALMKELLKHNNLLENIVISRGHELKLKGLPPLLNSRIYMKEK